MRLGPSVTIILQKLSAVVGKVVSAAEGHSGKMSVHARRIWRSQGAICDSGSIFVSRQPSSISICRTQLPFLLDICYRATELEIGYQYLFRINAAIWARHTKSSTTRTLKRTSASYTKSSITSGFRGKQEEKIERKEGRKQCTKQ